MDVHPASIVKGALWVVGKFSLLSVFGAAAVVRRTGAFVLIFPVVDVSVSHRMKPIKGAHPKERFNSAHHVISLKYVLCVQNAKPLCQAQYAQNLPFWSLWPWYRFPQRNCIRESRMVNSPAIRLNYRITKWSSQVRSFVKA